MSNLFRKKAAVYCYFNTNENIGISSEMQHEILEQQKKSLIKFADQNGWQIYDYYIDFVEDNITDYPEFNRLYLDAKAHLFDIVLCQSLTCFADNIELSLKIIDQDFPRWGIRFIGISDFNDDNTNEISYSITNQSLCLKKNLLIRDWYLEDMSKQMMSLQDDCSLKSESPFVPFGYRIDPVDATHLLHEKNTVQIIKFIYNIFSEGLSIREIAACLNDSGIPAPPVQLSQCDEIDHTDHSLNSFWKEQTILSILKNEFYYSCKRNKFSYQPIVSEALWKCVQSQLIHDDHSETIAGVYVDPYQKTFVFPT